MLFPKFRDNVEFHIVSLQELYEDTVKEGAVSAKDAGRAQTLLAILTSINTILRKRNNPNWFYDANLKAIKAEQSTLTKLLEKENGKTQIRENGKFYFYNADLNDWRESVLEFAKTFSHEVIPHLKRTDGQIRQAKEEQGSLVSSLGAKSAERIDRILMEGVTNERTFQI